MNEKTLKTLEFTKIIEQLAAKAVSPMGKEQALALLPVTDIETIRATQKETSEAVSLILQKGSLPLGGIRDIRPCLTRVALAGTLSIAEFVHVADFLYVTQKVADYGNENTKNEQAVLLREAFDMLSPQRALEKEIGRCIMNGEVSDDASSELREIRRNIKVSNNRIREQLNNVIQSQAYKNMLQDSVITIRNDRYCVPVKQEYRNTFQGMIHDQSSTGSTLFIEPMAVVTLNNKIKELKSAEKSEIEKILRNLSQKVFEHSSELQINLEILSRLDFVFAKGELSLSMNGTEPIFNNELRLNIKKGRHPLLDKTSVVPTDIYLGDTFQTLLITGPNTGGKTVCLKTIGLFTLMGQAGLHISAFDNSELSVFDQVFADIGDEQSIEQSLSTFSAHMTNIVRILSQVTPSSLLLFDELGAGTDPTEGAALAISILQYLQRFNVRSAVTTHYSELKAYALSAEGVENASCEFDVETLKPTYRLLIGIPGKSNAFAISQKLGLPDSIIDEAKNYISHQDKRFEDIITDLEISKKTVILEQERAEQYRREAEKLKKDFETQQRKFLDQKEKILLKAREEARAVLDTAKEQADLHIKEIRKASSQQELERSRQVIREKITGLDNDIQKMNKQKRAAKPAPKNLRKGDSVYIYSMNQSAIVAQAPDQNGDVMVQAGIMKIRINIAELSLDEQKQEKPEKRNYSSAVKAKKSQFISQEVDLRGCMTEEGIEKADKFLDDAAMAGLEKVTLIHGKGTGALRSAIQNHLRRHPHVKSFRLGTYGEGETGVTVVELK